MENRRWMEIYQRIESDFQYPRSREYRARAFLSELIGDRGVSVGEIKRAIGPVVYVVGNAPVLEDEISLIKPGYPVLAADDAAVFLWENNILPDIVLTDLDGDVKKLSEIDTIFGIHAHGDNIERLYMVSMFDRVFGTTQVEPVWNVYNFGGFTDGDRCVYLAAHFGAEVHLVGFDFSEPRYVPGKDMAIKRRKLEWAKWLIEELQRTGARIVWEKLKS